MGTQEEREEGTEAIFEGIMTEFPQINVRHPITDPGNSKNTEQNKCQKTTPRHIIVKSQEYDISKIKKNLERSQ